MGLKEYRQKRRFEVTPEPEGGVPPTHGRPRFVVQEHHARRVHWDLRLEMEGVLRSWAIPKGPSLDPSDKRLAVLVEDHPLEYGEFEGVIPPGNYGAGSVMLWDRGTYECLEGDPAEAFRRGKLTLIFHGEKLKGEFHFVRTKRNEGRDWLLFKGKDEFARPGYSPLGTRSVKTGRTIDEIAADRGDRWMPAASTERQASSPGGHPEDTPGVARTPSTPKEERPGRRAPSRRQTRSSPPRMAKSGSPTVSRSRRASAPRGKQPRGAAARAKRSRARASAPDDEESSPDPFPAAFRPMLAQAVDRPFDRPGWLFEVKWDGVRALAFVRRHGAAQEIVLYNRSLRRVNAQFPEIVEALSGLEEDSVILDGEIIAPDEHGQPSFARLQQRLHREAQNGNHPDSARIPVSYAVFDCMYLRGRDLRGRPLEERRRMLEDLALPPGVIRGDVVEEHGRALFDAVREHGLEGIVGKKATSPYRPGVRTPEWQKIKVRQSIEAVVGGYTRGKGSRAGTFGALILGQYDPAGSLVHTGQAGGGFSDADLRLFTSRLTPLVTDVCPFAVRPRMLSRPTWVRPEVVVEVAHGGRTPDGMLRFPEFLRVRDDVPPQDARLVTAEDGAQASRALPNAKDSARQTPADDGQQPGDESDDVRANAGDGGSDGARPRTARGRAGRPTHTTRSRRRSAADRPPSGEAPPPGLAFTHLDKVFFPERGYTKGDAIEYYRKITPYILPHLLDRPLTLRRFPDGIHGEDFFQKDITDPPPFVRTVRIWSDQGDRDLQAVIGTDTPTLLWLAQLGCIEMHAWYSRITPVEGTARPRPTTVFAGSKEAIEGSVLNYPDFIVFDIDPFLFPKGKEPVKRHGEFDPDYSQRGFEASRRAALWLNEALESLDLRSFVKTSGKTGLHVFVPIVRRYMYEQTHAFAKTVTSWLATRHPDELTLAWAVRDRVGKVFLDYNQNARGKTLASVYSLRPVPEATVSVPVTWEELRAGFDPLQWTITSVFDRLKRVGDLWSDIPQAAQSLDRALRGHDLDQRGSRA